MYPHSRICSDRFFVSLIFLISTISFISLAHAQPVGRLAVTSEINGKFRELSAFSRQMKAGKKARNVRLKLPVPGVGKVQLDIKPINIFADDYRSEVTDESGVQAGTRPTIDTFDANILGRKKADFARLSINPDRASKISGFEGLIRINGKYYSIKQNSSARKAKLNELKIIDTTNTVRDVLACGASPDTHESQSTFMESAYLHETSQVAAFDLPLPTPVPTPVTSALTFGIMEIGTEADFSFINSLGGVQQANNFIGQIVNWVDGVYRRDLSVGVRLRYQHGWSSSDEAVYGPLSGSGVQSVGSGTLLSAFRSYGEAVLDPSRQNDHMHIFSNRPFSGSNVIGIAWVSGACRQNFRFGLSSNYPYASPVRQDISSYWGMLMAHEMGHNVGADHDASTAGIMYPAISNVQSFSVWSKAQIAGYLSTLACLSPDSGAPPPSPSIQLNVLVNGSTSATVNAGGSYTLSMTSSSQGYNGVVDVSSSVCDRYNPYNCTNAQQGYGWGTASNGVITKSLATNFPIGIYKASFRPAGSNGPWSNEISIAVDPYVPPAPASQLSVFVNNGASTTVNAGGSYTLTAKNGSQNYSGMLDALAVVCNRYSPTQCTSAQQAIGWGATSGGSITINLGANFPPGIYKANFRPSGSNWAWSNQIVVTVDPYSAPPPSPTAVPQPTATPGGNGTPVGGNFYVMSSPQPVTIAAGGVAQFSVTVQGGPVAYQWRKNGIEIPGATSASYSVVASSQNNGSSFSVKVYNTTRTFFTVGAVLTVQ